MNFKANEPFRQYFWPNNDPFSNEFGGSEVWQSYSALSNFLREVSKEVLAIGHSSASQRLSLSLGPDQEEFIFVDSGTHFNHPRACIHTGRTFSSLQCVSRIIWPCQFVRQAPSSWLFIKQRDVSLSICKNVHFRCPHWQKDRNLNLGCLLFNLFNDWLPIRMKGTKINVYAIGWWAAENGLVNSRWAPVDGVLGYGANTWWCLHGMSGCALLAIPKQPPRRSLVPEGSLLWMEFTRTETVSNTRNLRFQWMQVFRAIRSAGFPESKFKREQKWEENLFFLLKMNIKRRSSRWSNQTSKSF